MKKSATRIIEGCIILAGFMLFAFFIHRENFLRILAYVFLFISTFGIYYTSRNFDLLKIIGLSGGTKGFPVYLPLAVCVGCGLAIAVRHNFDMRLLPRRFTYVALLAPIIGIMEELVFRGYLQGHFRPNGRLFSMIVATAGHTIYKYIVIAALPEPVVFNFRFLILWTFLGGFLFSILRELSRSIYPSALAHACFDIMLYGAFASLPVWTWH